MILRAMSAQTPVLEECCVVAMIVKGIGSSQHAVVIEGDDVTPARTVVLNKPEAAPLTGVPYLSNDLQRTMLQVGLQDVSNSPT